MKLEVKLFARARDLAGTGAAPLELRDGATVGELRAALAERFQKLRPLVAALLVAVGREYADDTKLLGPEADVACFPPVSGG
jgi:molybdopterin converting factor subunit 1